MILLLFVFSAFNLVLDMNVTNVDGAIWKDIL